MPRAPEHCRFDALAGRPRIREQNESIRTLASRFRRLIAIFSRIRRISKSRAQEY
jgi:hypothetical protein